jgi:hypothetical protein
LLQLVRLLLIVMLLFNFTVINHKSIVIPVLSLTDR